MSVNEGSYFSRSVIIGVEDVVDDDSSAVTLSMAGKRERMEAKLKIDATATSI